jgi:restriction endonuclease S subunit
MQSISFESQDAVTIPHIYFSVYGDVKVPDIPLSDQQKIARYLDEKIKYLDEKIKYTLSLKESLEKLKLCLIKKTIDIDPTKSCIKTKIKYISNFIQATKFPYNKTIYPNNNSEHNIAIVTAGKTFIYGYGEKQTYPSFNKPAILFDDFTSECKFIDIPFYFPSSAGKIIINNNKSDIK